VKIFDSHFHIINPRYPLVKNNGYLPPEFTVENYLDKVKDFGIIGGAIVSGSFQAFDYGYLRDSLKRLGKRFVGVANIPMGINQKELDRLNDMNIVAVRFNLKRGGSEKKENLIKLSNQLYDKYGWHTELYIDSKDLKELNPILMEIQKFSIDHLGLSKKGLTDLYHWVEKGIKVKVTGFGRIDFDPLPVIKKIYEIDPNCLMFGTDLPSTRAKAAFSNKDINLIKDNFNKEEQEKIFFRNAEKWYRK
jgi:predicted TIM-barrel fold metal-dependent hydrolase